MHFVALLAAVGAAVALPLESRAVLGVDDMVSFSQTVPSGMVGTLDLKYKPYLYVYNGCVTFPAVDAEGNTNGGLNPTGSTNGNCSSSTGQIYSRSTTYNSYYAIMYASYWPKNEPSDGLGHRHDWEGIVVWLSSESTSASLVSVAPSAHGDWNSETAPALSGNAPLIEYISYWPLDHQLTFTSMVGGQQPLIAWESLPAVAQTALVSTDWGDANVPFIDVNFDNNLAAAYPS